MGRSVPPSSLLALYWAGVHPGSSFFFKCLWVGPVSFWVSLFHLLFGYSIFSSNFLWKGVFEVNFLGLVFLKNTFLIHASWVEFKFSESDDAPLLSSGIRIANETPHASPSSFTGGFREVFSFLKTNRISHSHISQGRAGPSAGTFTSRFASRLPVSLLN